MPTVLLGEAEIKALIQRERIPGRLAARMPLSDVPGEISRLLQHIGNRRFFILQAINVIRRKLRHRFGNRPRHPAAHDMIDPGLGRILAAQKCHAGGRTSRCRRVRVGEASPFAREPVQMWRFVDRIPVEFVTGNILPPQVVDHDVHDIRQRLVAAD